jgi:transposase-like protein
MRFAVRVSHATIGSVTRHLSGGYAIHVRRRRGTIGGVFKHYIAFPVDGESFLDDFVMWLHRPGSGAGTADASSALCWTGDFAYLSSTPASWITTDQVLSALGPAESAKTAYQRRKTQAIDPEIVAAFTRPSLKHGDYSDSPTKGRPTIEQIVQVVARYSGISEADMRSDSRKRAVTKAKIIAAVLSTRNGASVAAVARYFGRSRSTLVEQAEHYREKQPHLFDEAERALADFLGEGNGAAAAHRDVPLASIAPRSRRSGS